MSRWVLGLAVAALAVAPAVRADEAADKVINDAIKAHGGKEALDKFKAGSSKMKGDMTVLGMDLEFTGDLAYELPNKYKMTILTEVAGQKLTIVQVVNGTRVKNTLNGMALKIGDAEKAELAQAAAMQEIAQLTPLLGSKKYTTKADKEEEVNGKKADVVMVTAKDFKATKLYFDKESHLLVKTSRKGLAPGMGDPQEVVEETILSDYKAVEGVQTPMKMAVTHDGKKFMNVTVSDVKLSEKSDTSFATDD
jgi:hypothetical protein